MIRLWIFSSIQISYLITRYAYFWTIFFILKFLEITAYGIQLKVNMDYLFSKCKLFLGICKYTLRIYLSNKLLISNIFCGTYIMGIGGTLKSKVINSISGWILIDRRVGHVYMGIRAIWVRNFWARALESIFSPLGGGTFMGSNESWDLNVWWIDVSHIYYPFLYDSLKTNWDIRNFTLC